jgi:NAD+ synthase (glutamine-hydrolysing)
MPRPLPVAVAQFHPVKGDLTANLARIGEALAAADALPERPRVLVLPETITTGYFLEGGVRDVAMTAGALARALDAEYRRRVRGPHALDVVVGFYERWRDALHNSALVVRLGAREGGEVLHVHRKNFLPTYGLFDEERFVERGTDLQAFDTGWGRMAVLVCEDAWHGLSGTIAALDGAQLVCVIAAAPGRGVWPREGASEGPASHARWERLLCDLADEHGVYVAFANLAGTEGGKQFPGGSMLIGPRGDVRVRAALWRDAMAAATLDLDDVHRARADQPLLADLRVQLPHLERALRQATDGPRMPPAFDDVAPPSGGHDAAPASSTPTEHEAHGFAVRHAGLAAHGGPPPLALDATLTEAMLVNFLRDEFARRGFTRAVVGLSGGVDSAVTAALAARALGAANVLAVRMPYRTSSPDSLAHAQLVIDAFGLDTRTVDISAAVDGYLQHEPDADGTRRGNVMARQRMIVLFDLAAKHAALPVGTGNKTERLFGYFTWHADDSPPVNPLGDLFKTQVWALARHLGVPDAVVDKAPSADLVQGQTDEGDFGISYAKADALLHWMLHGYDDAALAAHGFPDADIALVRGRLDRTHWKRKLPTVAMISGTAIGESYLRPVDY